MKWTKVKENKYVYNNDKNNPVIYMDIINEDNHVRNLDRVLAVFGTEYITITDITNCEQILRDGIINRNIYNKWKESVIYKKIKIDEIGCFIHNMAMIDF
jgi:hypothetical protein